MLDQAFLREEKTMNSRERMIATLKFQPIDRVPLVEWNIRGATMARWVSEGYPQGVSYEKFFDLDPLNVEVPLRMSMYPLFEEKVIEQTERYKIWQDELGAIRKDFAETENPGFVTRSWLSFPVTDRKSFREMQRRYLSGDPARICDSFEARCKALNQCHVPVHLSVPFLFWTVRDWVGFEGLCMMFYDDPALVHEMFEFLTDFCIETLKDKIDLIDIDMVEFKEDMAYKHAPMISPAMFREFMFPHYRRFIDFLKGHGVKIVYSDCDGFPGGLIPEFIEAGVDAMSPVEIAAGCDPLKLRREYPNFGMLGCMDKRELAKTKKHIYSEVMGKLPKMLELGGFVPHIDHAIPHDVPLENYMYYRDILTRVVLGESVDPPRG